MLLIDADALTGVLEQSKNHLMAMGLDVDVTLHTLTGLNMAQSSITIAPAVDAVEVVRCKDCKYSYHNKYCTNEQWKDNGATVTIEADDFCSYGERKEE